MDYIMVPFAYLTNQTLHDDIIQIKSPPMTVTPDVNNIVDIKNFVKTYKSRNIVSK